MPPTKSIDKSIKPILLIHNIRNCMDPVQSIRGNPIHQIDTGTSYQQCKQTKPNQISTALPEKSKKRLGKKKSILRTKEQANPRAAYQFIFFYSVWSPAREVFLFKGIASFFYFCFIP